MQTHLVSKPFINKPIENYKGLKIINADDNAIGSYATSLYSDFGEKYGNEDNENENNESPNEQPNSEGDEDGDFAHPVASSPVTSSTFRP